MKPIRDIAIEYYARYAFMGNDRAFAERHFEEGAAWMQVELTCWHDPKEELPPNDACVLCKVTGCAYTEYLVLNWYNGRWWFYIPYSLNNVFDSDNDTWREFNGEVVGWREISE